MPRKSIVVVIDPQQGWLHEQTEGMFGHLSETLEKENWWNKTVIATFHNPSTSPFRKNLSSWKMFIDDTDAALLPSFQTPKVRVFPRDTYGLPKALWQYLRANQITDILLTGVETNAAIVKAALDAFDLNYCVWMIPELVASTYGEYGQQCGLDLLRKVLGGTQFINLPQARVLLSSDSP